MNGIEHPDHTGESANPLAPWNWPDAATCENCNDVLDEVCRGCGCATCSDCDAVECADCYSGPSDEEQWRAAEAASLSPLPDARDEHDPTL